MEHQALHLRHQPLVPYQLTLLNPKLALSYDCGVACQGRCKLSKRPNLCKRACGSCCSKCNCVPPGTAGNREQCPCYANLTTPKKVHKCP
ncbi:hypothetical protein PTKIN_Ptkin08bG0196700 [Pterospermum kingtungense]